MQKNIALKLTLEQKIKILFSKNIQKDLIENNIAIPQLLNLDECLLSNEKTTLLSSLANSWNYDYVNFYVNEIVNEIHNKKINLVIIPFFNTFLKNISEEIYLTKELLTKIIFTLKNHHIYVMIKIFDEEMNESSINEKIDLIRNLDVDGIIIKNNPTNPNLLIDKLNYEGLILIESIDENYQTVYSLYTALSNKYNKIYEEYKPQLENYEIDMISFDELIIEQFKNDEAIIDQEILKVLEFSDNLYQTENITQQEINNDETYLRFKEESMVLIKNDNLLPLYTDSFLAILGDIEDEIEISNLISIYFPNNVGYFKTSSISFADEELESTNFADIVIILISAQENITTISLLHKNLILKYFDEGKKVIINIPPTIHKLDKDIIDKCASIFVGQVNDYISLKAFLNIVVGEIVPSGKLTFSIYAHDDSQSIIYPFGFGLSYIKFQYVNLIFSEDKVQYTINNPSNVDGYEISQIYINNSEKMLIGYNKGFIKAGESKKIVIDIKDKLSEFNNNFNIEVSSSKLQTELLFTYHRNDNKNENKPIHKQNVTHQKTYKFNWPLFIAVIITLSINVLLIYIVQFLKEKEYSILIAILILLIDVWAYKIISDISKANVKKHKRSIDSMLHLMDDAEYLEATNEEVFIQDEIDNITDYQNGGFENENITIIRPKKVIVKESIYADEIQMEAYCNLMVQYMLDSGLKIDNSLSKEINSSLAATHLIILNSASPKLSQYFIELYANFIGANYFYCKENANWKTFSDLFADENQLKDCLKSAYNNKDKIHIMLLNYANLNMVSKYFSRIMDYALNPLMPCYLNDIESLGISELPNNIWFVINPYHFDKTALPQELLPSSIIVEVNAKVDVPKDVVEGNAIKISYDYFMDNLRDSLDIYYIKEELWKKIDQIEQYVNERVPFTIDNRVFRQLERYTTIYLMCGGDENEAIDNVLSSKLLPIISKLKIKKKGEEDEGLFALCEKLFGLENISKSKVILSHIQEVNK